MRLMHGYISKVHILQRQVTCRLASSQKKAQMTMLQRMMFEYQLKLHKEMPLESVVLAGLSAS